MKQRKGEALEDSVHEMNELVESNEEQNYADSEEEYLKSNDGYDNDEENYELISINDNFFEDKSKNFVDSDEERELVR
jgi:hypothetical protein